MVIDFKTKESKNLTGLKNFKPRKNLNHNIYKPHGFFLGFLATFICFYVTFLFYRYLYIVVNQIKTFFFFLKTFL